MSVALPLICGRFMLLAKATHVRQLFSLFFICAPLDLRLTTIHFLKNSWYFRNALVRYVYKNREGVMPEPKYLERFFRNMLLGEQRVLKNRYLILNPPSEYCEQLRFDTPTSTEQVGNHFWPGNENILRVVRTIGNGAMSVKDIMSAVQLKDRKKSWNIRSTLHSTQASCECSILILFDIRARNIC